MRCRCREQGDTRSNNLDSRSVWLGLPWGCWDVWDAGIGWSHLRFFRDSEASLALAEYEKVRLLAVSTPSLGSVIYKLPRGVLQDTALDSRVCVYAQYLRNSQTLKMTVHLRPDELSPIELSYVMPGSGPFN